MVEYYPEGWLIDTAENRAALQSTAALIEACRTGQILEGRALVCDSSHNLLVDLGCVKGIIPRDEGALGIREGTVRDIAIISRVNRPVCFVVTGFQKDGDGRTRKNAGRRSSAAWSRATSSTPRSPIWKTSGHLQTSAAELSPCFPSTPFRSPASIIPANGLPLA